MFKEKEPELVDLTPEFVRKFASLAVYKGDRNPDGIKGRRHINWLRGRAAKGRFFTPEWNTAELDGVVYRVNGGHSSKMLLGLLEENGSAKLPARKVFVRHFVCESLRDMADLFEQFDHASTTRTNTDKRKAHQATEPQLEQIGNSILGRILEGIAFAEAGFGDERPLAADDRIALMHRYQRFICWAEGYAKKKTLWRPGVMAAIFATCRVSQKHARVFWQHVLNEDHPVRNNATRTLADFLHKSIADNRSRPGLWTARAMYVKSIHAWNAWLEDRHVSELKYHKRSELPAIKKPNGGIPTAIPDDLQAAHERIRRLEERLGEPSNGSDK